jgi:hypothetical protein
MLEGGGGGGRGGGLDTLSGVPSSSRACGVRYPQFPTLQPGMSQTHQLDGHGFDFYFLFRKELPFPRNGRLNRLC